MNEELKEKQQKEVNNKWREIFKNHFDKLLPKAPKIFYPIKEEEFKNKYLKAIEIFHQKVHNNIEKYIDLKKDFLIMKKNYADGKMPREPMNHLFYYLFLFLLVILEVPVNYNTIENIIHKPIIAAFLTLAIGMLLVFIAHFHGAFFKQLKFIINTPDLEDKLDITPRKYRIVQFIISLIVLIGIFYFLYIIRIQYYKDMLGSEIDDDVLMGAKLYTKVFTLMVGNFAIYILAVIASYKIHNPIPNYKETYKKMNKELKKIIKNYKELIKELDRINNRYGVKE